MTVERRLKYSVIIYTALFQAVANLFWLKFVWYKASELLVKASAVFTVGLLHHRLELFTLISTIACVWVYLTYNPILRCWLQPLWPSLIFTPVFPLGRVTRQHTQQHTQGQHTRGNTHGATHRGN